jgi:hypothetical protein
MKNYNGKEGLLESQPVLLSLIYQSLMLCKKRDPISCSRPPFLSVRKMHNPFTTVHSLLMWKTRHFCSG